MTPAEINYFFVGDDLLFNYRVIPISDEEERFVRRTAWGFLSELFTSLDVDIANLERESVDPDFLDAEATRINLR